MANRAVGSVVVLQDGRVIGLVTDRLLARECLAKNYSPRSSVRGVMIRDVALLSPDDTIFAACDTMRSAHFAQRIPVVGPGRELLGIIGIEDIAAVAKDLVNAILDKELHKAKRARALTGAKRVAKSIRRPTKAHKLPAEFIIAKRRPSRPGRVANPMPGRRIHRQARRAPSVARPGTRRTIAS
jgi:CBS domain-containing protein